MHNQVQNVNGQTNGLRKRIVWSLERNRDRLKRTARFAIGFSVGAGVGVVIVKCLEAVTK